MKQKAILITALLLFSALIAVAGDRDSTILSPEGAFYSVYMETEAGFLAVPFHTIQIGESGTNFDYRTQGGQDILFPFQRFAIGVELWDSHTFQVLYQPLEVITNPVFDEDVTIDNVTFAAGTPMELKYGFPFWRLTYLYDFLPENHMMLAFGAALQLRNASITFESQDGSQQTISQNLGPVPAITMRSKYEFDNGFFLELDVAGLYASSSFINGASFDFEGSILDASGRMGLKLDHGIELFGNLRFLGGTAKGKSQYVDRTWTESETAYTSNYLSTLVFSMGVRIQ